MARGLLLLPHYKPNPHLIQTVSSSYPTKFPIFPTPTRSNFVRLLCTCSSTPQDELSNYKQTFAKRMAMAGLKPHHHIAVGVSGGPDSMALCLLAANWKTNGLNAASRVNNGFVDGLLAIIVDHGLRAESKSEAEMVQNRVLKMGIRCEIAHCDWIDGKPKLGHLQEAARDIRYEKLQHICSQHQIGVLLIAHHADDQAELFVLRLSRNSGVLGLAGMALTTQLFAAHRNKGILNSVLLVRPLLDFSKQDLYKICEMEKQEWVEDPTNQNTIFARNRIRKSLRDLSSSIFKSELQAVILACRRTRVYVDQICQTLINQAVTVMPQEYAVINLEILNPSQVLDICLSKFLTLLVQFVSQRQRPVRGNAQKLLLDYIRTFPCKSSFTAAGCYLCAAPGSKGTKIIICCSVNSASPMNMESFYADSFDKQKVNVSTELLQIIENGKSYTDKIVLNVSNVHFLNAMSSSSESILTEAKRVKILSEPTFTSVFSLYKTEFENFQVKPETLSDVKSKKGMELVKVNELLHGQIGHFMDRFLVSWEFVCGNDRCRCCGSGQDSVMEVRHMVDADWLYLSELTKSTNLENCQLEQVKRSLSSLKSIPVAARRSLPVLVNPEGRVVSIPSVSFNICKCLKVSVEFSPRGPLGGGYSSFLYPLASTNRFKIPYQVDSLFVGPMQSYTRLIFLHKSYVKTLMEEGGVNNAYSL